MGFCPETGLFRQPRHSYAGIRPTTGGGIANGATRSRIAAYKFRVTDRWANCKRRGIDPFRYLADVLRRFPTTPPNQRTESLPDVWLQIHPLVVRKRAAYLDAAVRRRDNRAVRSDGYVSGIIGVRRVVDQMTVKPVVNR
jgi:hypothetical protein